MRYRENGDLERMQRFWFTGACEPRKRRRTSSKPLALAQFMSAFLLLGIGIIIAGGLLLCEKAYFGYISRYLAGATSPPWCTLISLSIAESLSHKAEKKPQNIKENNKDDNSNFDTDDTIIDNAEQHNEGIRNRKVPTLSKVLGLRNKERSSEPTSHAHKDGNHCLDPLCEMSFTAVTRELDICNKQIEMLQEALLKKDKSRTIRFPLSNQFTNTLSKEFNSENGSQWHQSDDNGSIKGDFDHKSNSQNDERTTSSLVVQDVVTNSGHVRQSLPQKSTQLQQKHLQNVSISEIETVL